jgi:hypothetical protein
MSRPISEDERALMTHVTMWGSDGYPVRKLGRGWTWDYRSIKGPPIVYRTKRAAVTQLESFLTVLREAYAEEAYERAVQEQGKLSAPST